MRRFSTFALAIALLLAACGGQPAAPAPTVAPTTAPTVVPTALPVPSALPVPTTAPAATAAPTTPPVTAAPAEAVVAIGANDSVGREIMLPAPPQRIISLAPSTTEILFALGVGERVIAVDDFSNEPPAVASLPKVGGLTGSPNFEQIAALEPDLVLGAGITAPETVQKIETLDIPIAIVGTPEASIETILADILLVGRLTDTQARADELTRDLRVRLAQITDTIRTAPSRPRVYWELDATDPARPFSVGPGSFVNELITLAGGENIFASADSPYPQISAEQVVLAEPDVILLASAQYGVSVESVGQRAGWADLSAVKAGKVYPLNADLVSRPGPRIVDGLESVAKLLHPELFP
jgi:iron complex transport system substrate-binding protein